MKNFVRNDWDPSIWWFSGKFANFFIQNYWKNYLQLKYNIAFIKYTPILLFQLTLIVCLIMFFLHVVCFYSTWGYSDLVIFYYVNIQITYLSVKNETKAEKAYLQKSCVCEDWGEERIRCCFVYNKLIEVGKFSLLTDNLKSEI